MSTAYPRRLAWAMLAGGMGLSISANGLHADPNPIAVVIAAIPPVTLWATLELVIRLPLRRRAWAITQKGVTLVLAGIAAVVSYSHIQEVCLRYGEDATIARLVPLCIDGMILAGSLGLIEIRAEERTARTDVGVTQSDTRVTESDTPVLTPVDSAPAPAPEPDSESPDLTGVTKSEAVRRVYREVGLTDAASIRGYLKPLGVEVADSTLFAVVKAEKSGAGVRPELAATNGHRQ